MPTSVGIFQRELAPAGRLQVLGLFSWEGAGCSSRVHHDAMRLQPFYPFNPNPLLPLNKLECDVVCFDLKHFFYTYFFYTLPPSCPCLHHSNPSNRHDHFSNSSNSTPSNHSNLSMMPSDADADEWFGPVMEALNGDNPSQAAPAWTIWLLGFCMCLWGVRL